MTAWDVKYLTGQDIKGWATETFCNMPCPIVIARKCYDINAHLKYWSRKITATQYLYGVHPKLDA